MTHWRRFKAISLFWALLCMVAPSAFAVTPMVAAGSGHTLLLGSDGQVEAWGNNFDGQVGDGTTTHRTLPVALTRGSFTRLSAGAGGSHSLALDADGFVFAWGNNRAGQAPSASVIAAALPAGVRVIEIAAGGAHSLALGSDGKVYAWGSNSYGQLGDGTTISRTAPVPVLQGARPSEVTITAIAAGHTHSLALGSDGRVYAWGNNSFGELGDGTTSQRATPVAVLAGALPEGERVTLIAASAHSLALDSNGRAYAWGNNYAGQLGDGTTTDRSSPVAVDMGDLPAGVTLTRLSAGTHSSLAIGSDGRLYTWGSNAEGQLGDGTTNDRSRPAAVLPGGIPAGISFTGIAAGGSHNAALGSDQRIYTWGSNEYGQLGDGSGASVTTPVAMARGAVPANATFTEILARGGYSLLRTGDGALYAWGSNAKGELGDGSRTPRHYPVAVAAGEILDWTGIRLAAGPAHILALDQAGRIYAWGSNAHGQLGDGTTSGRTTPVALPAALFPPGATITAVAGGGQHSLALDSDGQLYAWGWNREGALGNGTTDDSATPAAVAAGAIPAGIRMTQIAAGTFHSLALGSNGRIYAWGRNFEGQLGDGSFSQSTTPVEVLRGAIPAEVTIIGIYASSYTSLALGSDGRIYAWGSNESGKVGDGTTTHRSSPVAVLSDALPQGVVFTQVAPGAQHCLALGSDGRAYGWGENSHGQLGNGGGSFQTRPVAVVAGAIPNGVTLVQIASGGNHGLALGSDGGIYAWGYNRYGEVGNTLRTLTDTPTLPDLVYAAPNRPLSADPTPTTIAVTSSANPAYVDSTVTFTATVSSTEGTPQGSMSVFYDGYGFNEVRLNGEGKASSSLIFGPSPAAAGEHTLTFVYAGDTRYAASSQSYVQSFRKYDQTITFNPLPALVVNGTGELVATVSSRLPIHFSSKTPSVCTVEGAWVTGRSAGTCVIAADQDGDLTRYPAPQVTRSVAVQYALTVTRAGSGSGTVLSTPAGIDCGNSCIAPFAPGSNVTLVATAAAGSAFAGWSGACSGTAISCTVGMADSRSVTATFSPVYHTLSVARSGVGTVTSSPPGIDCGSDCSEPYAFGTSVTLSATAAAGSNFVGWSGACAGTGNCTVSMSAARSVGASFVSEPRGDLNGDGKGDLLWHNATLGGTDAWLMNGLARSSMTRLFTHPAWAPAASGDLDGNGTADILWHNPLTGATDRWLMNGLSRLSVSRLLTDTAWKPQLTADVDGNGKDDIVWYNASTGRTDLWLSNGNIFGFATLFTSTRWQVVAAGDLNGDGKDDLIWNNATTGETDIWLMNGKSRIGLKRVLTNVAWRPVAAGDLNGDGKEDILWYNETRGATDAWLMNGLSMSSMKRLLTFVGWRPVAARDLDGDGKADIIWNNAGTGQTDAWLMNGLDRRAGAVLLSNKGWIPLGK